MSDKAEHVIAYAVLACLGVRAFPRHLRLLASGLLAFAIVIEILQGVMNMGRQADVLDVLAGAMGISLIGLVPLYQYATRSRRG